jgi:hypothetical protein
MDLHRGGGQNPKPHLFQVTWAASMIDKGLGSESKQRSIGSLSAPIKACGNETLACLSRYLLKVPGNALTLTFK